MAESLFVTHVYPRKLHVLFLLLKLKEIFIFMFCYIIEKKQKNKTR